ncbi:MAG TPA: ABC transporter ATP-binding protein [Ktedonobacterales bacterium]
MTYLRLETLSKHFGATTAVDQVSLSVERGEFLTLLGPSGCGKTTILRMVAGFETPSGGSIWLENEDITTRPASKRPMGMVFQQYALFPHMTAAQNIAFGMRIQRRPEDAIRTRCAELLQLVGLSDRSGSYPHQLSGGQQQRVALARALAVEPKVLLLDEPLSALDAKVRVGLRDEIRRIQQTLKMTAIYVTHDQEEALAISDRIAVLARGRVEQLDQPEVIYNTPRTAFTATFVGMSNRFQGVVTSPEEGRCEIVQRTLHVALPDTSQSGDRVLITVRPEAVSIQPRDVDISAAAPEANALTGTITLRTFLGPLTRFEVRTDDGAVLMADVPSQRAQPLSVGQAVSVSFPPEACQALPLGEPATARQRIASTAEEEDVAEHA